MKSIAELKTSILQSVAETDDEKMLTDIQHYVTNLLKQSKKIVAYDSKGKALTLEDYQSSVEEARAQYKRGEIISQDEMEKRI
jgi:hypothetical protein